MIYSFLESVIVFVFVCVVYYSPSPAGIDYFFSSLVKKVDTIIIGRANTGKKREMIRIYM